MTELPALVSSAEACATLHIHRTTLTRWVQDNRIHPAYKMPGKNGAFLFTLDEVERAAAEAMTPAGAR